MRKSPGDQDFASFAITAQQIRLVQAAMKRPHIAREDHEASQRVIDSILRILRRQRSQFENIAGGRSSTAAQRAAALDQIKKIEMLEALAAAEPVQN